MGEISKIKFRLYPSNIFCYKLNNNQQKGITFIIVTYFITYESHKHNSQYLYLLPHKAAALFHPETKFIFFQPTHSRNHPAYRYSRSTSPPHVQYFPDKPASINKQILHPKATQTQPCCSAH